MPERASFGAAGAYWNVIQAGVAGRVSTAELWSALYNAALEETGSVPKFSFQDVTTLRSLAARNRQASETLARAAPSESLGPQHIGAIPHAGPGGGPATSSRFVVRFEQQITRGGQQTSVWRSSIFQTGLPPTKQSLINRLHRDGAILAEEYEDEQHVGIGDISILAA